MNRLHRSDFFPDSSFFVAQTRFRSRAGSGPHNHDFYEAFIIESGSMLHVINGEQVPMYPYSMALIYPEDCHDFLQLQKEEVRFVNLAFSEEVFRKACVLHAALSEEPFQHGSAVMQLSPEIGQQFIHRFYALRHNYFGDPVLTDRLLPSLIADLLTLSEVCRNPAESMPQWLISTCEQMKIRENFLEGLPCMIRLSGKSQEHITRVMRKTYGKTPTEYINALRLNYAASLLSTTSRQILSVALDSGFQNLSHFNKCFKAYFHMTPSQYRNSVFAITGS